MGLGPIIIIIIISHELIITNTALIRSFTQHQYRVKGDLGNATTCNISSIPVLELFYTVSAHACMQGTLCEWENVSVHGHAQLGDTECERQATAIHRVAPSTNTVDNWQDVSSII